MTRYLILLVCMFGPALPASAQHHSHYAGMETRDIKALSPEQVKGYQTGAGMGYAMPAELNGLPGPKHVIELAEQLELTDDQRIAADRIYERMHQRAVALGGNVIMAEAELDSVCAGGKLVLQDLKAAIDNAAMLNSELRFTHILAHFEMNEVLSEAQKQKYAKLRGYATED